jgi:hypothetical protein
VKNRNGQEQSQANVDGSFQIPQIPRGKAFENPKSYRSRGSEEQRGNMTLLNRRQEQWGEQHRRHENNLEAHIQEG